MENLNLINGVAHVPMDGIDGQNVNKDHGLLICWQSTSVDSLIDSTFV